MKNIEILRNITNSSSILPGDSFERKIRYHPEFKRVESDKSICFDERFLKWGVKNGYFKKN